MRKLSAESIKDVFIYFYILLILIITYSPVIFGYYGNGDDYYLFWGPGDIEGFNIIFFNGRFLCALIYSGYALFVHTISDLNVLRSISVGYVSFCAFI